MIDYDEITSSKDLQFQKRVNFLDFLLVFRGWFTRQDLIEEFKIAPAGATRDIAEYKKLISESDESSGIDFNDSLKRYVRNSSFKSRQEISFGSAISIFRRAIKKRHIGTSDPVPLESPPRLSVATTETLSIISQAIINKTCLEIEYGSLSSGNTLRKISPHALFESETNWYVRAFCHNREQFRTFKFTRLFKIKPVGENSCKPRDPINDNQWQKWVSLILEPHKNQNQMQKEMLASDYNMGKVFKSVTGIDEQDKKVEVSKCGIEVKVRAAVCGFWLQHWNIDCSSDGVLGTDNPRYQLQLANPEALYDVETAQLAPGIESND